MHNLVKEFDFQLTKEDILKGQGIDPERASKRLHDSAESIIEEAQSLLKPAAIYTVVKVTDFNHQTVGFEGGSFEGSLVAKAMAGADHLNIGACTIGVDLENKVQEMMNENPVKAVALDGAGIAAIGKVSKAVEDIISKEACDLETSLGMRVQPGQEGWPIEQQRQLFSVLPGEEIGIRLTETCLMIPRKSVSFVIPRGEALNSSVLPCDFCSKKNRCDWKKSKQAG